MPRITSCAAAVLLVSLAGPLAAPALATPTDDLKAEVQALEARVKQLEREANEGKSLPSPSGGAPLAPSPGVTAVDKTINPANATPGQKQQLGAVNPPAEPADLVRGGSFPGSFRLPGSDTSVAVHGWIDLQAFYDPQQYLGDKFQSGSILPPSNAREQISNSYHFHGKLTRLIVETRTPTKLGLFKTYFASDFYGFENGGSTGQQAIQNNNYGFRPVHIYGQLGGFLAGKTWSNFIDDPDSAESIDNAGPTGVPSEQVPQIRYTQHTKVGDLSVSAENPVTDYASNDKLGNTELTSKYNPVPDLTAKYEIQRKWGHLQASGVLRKLAYDDGAGHRSEANAGGGILGATINVSPSTAVGSQVFFGNGIMKFTPDDFGPVSSAQINNIGTAQQVLVPSNENGLTIYAAHVFNEKLRSNVAYGYYSEHWNDFIPADFTEPTITHTVHINLIYSPVKMADFGIEFIHGVKSFRPVLNTPPASADRIIGGFKFKF